LGIRRLTQLELRESELLFGVALVAILMLTMTAVGLLLGVRRGRVSGTGVPPVGSAPATLGLEAQATLDKARRNGKLALALCLGGLLLMVPAVWLGVRQPQEWIVVLGVFGLTSLCEIAAIVLGILGWRSGAGKVAVIVAVLLPVLAVPGLLLLGFTRVSPVRSEVGAGPGHPAAMNEVLRAALLRRLNEAGAGCADLQVTLAVAGDKATVRYRGLQNFTNAQGTKMHNANGSFTLLPDGQGHWRGTLAGVPIQLRVSVPPVPATAGITQDTVKDIHPDGTIRFKKNGRPPTKGD
jgi:hypothetical protein